MNTFSAAQDGLVWSFHLTLVTQGVFALYCYRDIWPLMTFTLPPADTYATLWAQVSILAFVAVVEPLFEPYPYIPVDPKVRAAPHLMALLMI